LDGCMRWMPVCGGAPKQPRRERRDSRGTKKFVRMEWRVVFYEGELWVGVECVSAREERVVGWLVRWVGHGVRG